jgi:uncharacterized protein
VRKQALRKHRRSISETLRFRLWVVLTALALVVAARGASAEDAPISPAPERWVTDRAGMLSPAARTALDRKLESYEQATGHQVVVWIGDSIGGAPLDDFAVRTFKAWQLGRKGQDDGILMIVLARDRKIAIEVGYGLEAQVPDITASRIINDVMVPKLRAEDAEGAIDAGVNAVLESIEGKPFQPAPDAARPDPQAQRPGKGQLIVFGILAVVFLLLLITNPALAMHLLFVLASGSGRGRHGGGFGGGGFGGGGGFSGGGGRSGGGGARGSW